MTFQINGMNGKYDELIKDDSVRYGRNAVENHAQYMETPLVNDNYTVAPILDFSPTAKADEYNEKVLDKFIKENDEYLRALPPLEFEYRYMPNGKFNGMALMGTAYEEMGINELPVKEFENRYLVDDSMTAEPLDINKDGKIDLSEYSTTILASDVLSKGTPDVRKVDGEINSKGFNAMFEYSKKANAAAAAKLYSDLYNTYGLSDSYKQFLSDKNNTIQ